MFSTNPNYTKLKTHLRLAINRLKLLEKKKTELAQKARKEIAEYIAAGKSERAKIRVEHIIREDYMVEAMEIVEMYCDLILARFGLVTQMKELDEGLAEAISSLIWVAPRMHTDVQVAKYGKIYADACRNENVNTLSDKLKHKMSVQSPPKILVEKYLIEIAKNYNVEYVPDEQVMREEEGRDAMLIDINGPPMPPGFIGYPQQPTMTMPNLPSGPPPSVTPFSYPSPPHVPSPPAPNVPTPQPRSRVPNHFPELPDLPSVPSDLILPSVPHSNNSNTSNNLPNAPNAPDEIDFDDLNRRFEELKKKK
ncbi:hypothetical protein HF086_012711 [Spodoptera exigua]|uniref:IST1 homolog n=1 Tax=Spodoptera exigua TaxID=7107 RepID=A0A922SEG6_SPOEX|nr:hypothetical protein HF086_012711 [Spodoptera exigua]